MAIFVQRNSQKLGPYTLAELRSQLASGALSLKDYVWWTGQTEWIPLVGSPVLAPGFEDPDPAVKKGGDGPTGTSPFSIAALVAGLLVFMAFFTSIPAIVFGLCALDDLKKNKRRTGRRMALIGLALGVLSTGIWGVLVGLYYYNSDTLESMKNHDEAVNSQPFVPPAPKASAPGTNAAPAQ